MLLSIKANKYYMNLEKLTAVYVFDKAHARQPNVRGFAPSPSSLQTPLHRCRSASYGIQEQRVIFSIS